MNDVHYWQEIQQNVLEKSQVTCSNLTLPIIDTISKFSLPAIASPSYIGKDTATWHNPAVRTIK